MIIHQPALGWASYYNLNVQEGKVNGEKSPEFGRGSKFLFLFIQ